MRRGLASGAGVWFMALAASRAATAHTPAQAHQLAVCLVASQTLLIAVSANLGAEAKLGVASPLFTLMMPGNTFGWGAQQYDVSADGRFLAAVVEPHLPDRPAVTVALNASAGLKPSPAR
jgi:hypothetical protein